MESLNQLCAISQVIGQLKKRENELREQLLPGLKTELMELMLRYGKRITTLEKTTPRSSINVGCKEYIKQLPLQAGQTLKSFLSNKLSNDLVRNLVGEGEFIINESINLANPMHLLETNPKLAKKLEQLILATTKGVRDQDGNVIKFTKAESEEVFNKVNFITTKPGHIDRMVQYADGNLSKLEQLLNLIPVQWSLSHAKTINASSVVRELLTD